MVIPPPTAADAGNAPPLLPKVPEGEETPPNPKEGCRVAPPLPPIPPEEAGTNGLCPLPKGVDEELKPAALKAVPEEDEKPPKEDCRGPLPPEGAADTDGKPEPEEAKPADLPADTAIDGFTAPEDAADGAEDDEARKLNWA